MTWKERLAQGLIFKNINKLFVQMTEQYLVNLITDSHQLSLLAYIYYFQGADCLGGCFLFQPIFSCNGVPVEKYPCILLCMHDKETEVHGLLLSKVS